jgi:thiol:disulfide interchange protein
MRFGGDVASSHSMTATKAESAEHLPLSIRAALLVVWFATVTFFVAFSDVSVSQTSSVAKPPTFLSSTQPPAPLPVDEAFAVTAALEKGNLVVTFTVLPGHYLYRDRFEFQRDGGAIKTVDAFAQAAGAVGKKKKDPNFGDVMVFDQPVVLSAGRSTRAKSTLVVTYQGCSEIAGVCYPPTRRTFALTNGAQAVAASELGASGVSKFLKKPAVTP